MPKVGKYDYPVYGPKIAIESLEKIRDAKVTSIVGVAHVLDHKSINSGGFQSKLASMDKYYGLIDRRGDAIEITPLGKRIAYPADSEEKAIAIREMLLKVPLINDLYERLGEVYDRDQFFIHLSELAGVDRDIAVKETSNVRKIYDEALPYLRASDSVSKEEDSARGVPQVPTQNPPSLAKKESVPDGMIKLEVAGSSAIIVPIQAPFIDGLIAYLESMKEKLKGPKVEGENSI